MARQQPRRRPNRSTRRPAHGISWLSAPVLLAGLQASPVQAGSVTAESIWDSSNAIQRAQSQLPAGATVTRTDCTVVNVRTGNDRYICTVFYAAPAAPSSSAPSAPAP